MDPFPALNLVPGIPSCNYLPEHNRATTEDSTSHLPPILFRPKSRKSRVTPGSHLAKEAFPGLQRFSPLNLRPILAWGILHASLIRTRPKCLPPSPPKNVNRSTDGYQTTARASRAPLRAWKVCTRGQDPFQKLRRIALNLSR